MAPPLGLSQEQRESPIIHAPVPIHPPTVPEYTLNDHMSDSSVHAVSEAVNTKKVIGSHPVTGAKTFSTPHKQRAKASSQPSSANMSSSSSKVSRMPKTKRSGIPRVQRPAKRHLVRWTEAMDKKMLLAIQQECNRQNITLPWKEIGETIGPGISGGAVVQHLSKLRIRMVAEGLEVPPPLKRGGGSKISTMPSTPRRSAKTSSSNAARGNKVKKSIKPTSRKRLHTDSVSNDDDEDDDDDNDEFKNDLDSDAEYGKPLAKRTKTAAVSKHRLSTQSSNSHGSDSENSSDDEPKYEEDLDGNRVVAAGASFLQLEDDAPPKPKSSPSPKASLADKPSKIITLPLNKTAIKQESSQDQEQESDNNESDENEDEYEDEEQASRAAHTLEALSRTSTPFATKYTEVTSPHGGSLSITVPRPPPINTNMGSNSNYGYQAYGGLPLQSNLRRQSFQEQYQPMIGYAGDQGRNADTQSWLPIAGMQNHHPQMGYGPGYSDQHFGFTGLPSDDPFASNFSFNDQNTIAPHAIHSDPSPFSSYPRPSHQPTYSAGTNTSNSAGPSTVNQTPINNDGDYFPSTFDDNKQKMFAGEPFGLRYSGYHHDG